MILEIGKIIKEYESGEIKTTESKESELYNINQIINLYPLLSKHIITNGINNGKLKVTWIGNKRYFKLEDVEDFIKSRQDKSNSILSEKIASWRDNNSK